jgi:hypothetical protein
VKDGKDTVKGNLHIQISGEQKKNEFRADDACQGGRVEKKLVLERERILPDKMRNLKAKILPTWM